MKWQNRAYCSPIFPKYSVAAERGAREGVCHGWHFAGAAFEGQKFGILVFALQCVTVSLYLFVIYSVLPVGGAQTRTGGVLGAVPSAAV